MRTSVLPPLLTLIRVRLGPLPVDWNNDGCTMAGSALTSRTLELPSQATTEAQADGNALSSASGVRRILVTPVLTVAEAESWGI